MTKQQAIETTEKLLKQVEELKQFIEQEESGQWEPEFGEKYWFVDGWAEVRLDRYKDDDYGEGALKIGNVFKTEAEAQQHALRLESMAVKWLPKVGEIYWRAFASAMEGIYAECIECKRDSRDIDDYLLGRTFKTKADCEAWIKRFSSAWSL